MKRKILLSFLSLALCVPAAVLFSGAAPVFHEGPAAKYGETRREIALKLFGKIRIVEDGYADYRVRIVDAAEDLRVCIVPGVGLQPGQWAIVDAAEDYAVTFVDVDEDITIRFVDGAEGPAPQ